MYFRNYPGKIQRLLTLLFKCVFFSMAPRITRKKVQENESRVLQRRRDNAAKQARGKRAKNLNSVAGGSRKRKTINKTTREERLEKKCLAERQRIQKIKENPEAHAAYLAAQKRRYQRRKKAGKIKLIGQLDPRSLRIKRKKNRLNVQNFRSRQKKTNESAADEHEDVNNNIQISSAIFKKQGQAAKKPQVNRKRVKCYNDNRKLRSQKTELAKKVHRLQKRLLRAKKPKEKVDQNSPEAIVDKFLKDNKCHVTADIRKKLVNIFVVKNLININFTSYDIF